MSSLPYVQQLSKVIVAQITQTIGWNSIQTTPLELLTDILHKYLEELTRQTQRYTELYGRTEPNLDDVALAFNELNINLADLEEYISNVDAVPCIINVPKFPLPKESNLNFLKPGSKEVVTRPVHVHEHLPPIYPHEESPPQAAPAEQVQSENVGQQAKVDNSTNIIQTYMSTNEISDKEPMDENGIFQNDLQECNIIAETTVIDNQSGDQDDDNTFKKPFVAPSTSAASTKTHSINSSEAGPADKNNIGKPTREIISCIMTTSGFISPAREGKLPEAKKPVLPIDDEPEPVAIEPKQRTPSPVPVVEKKHHSSKREREQKHDIQFEAASTSNPPHEHPFANDDSQTKVKLYEVVPASSQHTEPPVKKKLKKNQTDVAQIKEQKKQKKLKLMRENKLNANQSKDSSMKVSSMNNIFGSDLFVPPMNEDANLIHSSEKTKKKMQKIETLKKKHKKNRDFAAMMPFPPMESPEMQPKQKKKRMSKLSKKNLTAMGLNPNDIEGFAIPSINDDSRNISARDRPQLNQDSFLDNIKIEDLNHSKDSQKKTKQQQKLSNEPDKQKIKFFKKLTSGVHNKSTDDILNRSSLSQSSQMSNANDGFGLQQQWPKQSSSEMDEKYLPPVNLDELSPSKKSKMLKKLQKAAKEPKLAKIKKIKKDSPSKKSKTPKGTKSMDADLSQLYGAAAVQSNPMFMPGMNLLESINAPGFLPSNPLFQSVGFNLAQQNPYAGLQGAFDFANLQRFKRANFGDPLVQDPMEASSKHMVTNNPMNSPPKPLCNVAPLMPPSLLPMDFRGISQNQSFMPNQHQIMDQMHSHPEQIQSSMSFSSKKSIATSFMPHHSSSTASASASASQSFNESKRESFNSPIVIDSEDDDKFNPIENQKSNPMQSPDPDSQLTDSFSGEPKRKKLKDKSSSGKKEKKDKELGGIKIKKKKDKKDKSKNKSEKYANRDGDYTKLPKDKAALKKEKREKKKEKERLLASANDGNEVAGSASNLPHSGQIQSEWSRDAIDLNESQADTSSMETNAIPKLTLKLAPSSPGPRISRPSTPDFQMTKKSSKKKKKQWRTMEDESDKSQSEFDDSMGVSSKLTETDQVKREPSPELARISALITRPPKQKSSSKQQTTDFGSTSNARSEYSDDHLSASQSSTPSGRGRPKGSTSALKSGKKSKGSISFADIEPEAKSHASDNQSPVLDVQTNVLHTVDEQTNEENQVWICPACGRVDDGTPMIGCDGCDAWYHWVCVGIQVPPEQDQDWFCRVCILKKQEDKKKKRKKKDKKDH